MTLETQSILEDYDHDYDPEMDRLDSELDQLLASVIAIESFGNNPTTMGIMKAAGLLSGTALEHCAMESFSFDDPTGPESLLAVESLGEKIKEKAALWSAKILAFTASAGKSILNGLSALWDKISEKGKVLSAVAWDKTKAAGRTIKAHPYKTIAAVLAAAAAVVGIVLYVSTGIPKPSSGAKGITSFLNTIKDKISKIVFPGSKIVATVNTNGTKILYDIKTPGPIIIENGVPSALGWGQSSIKSTMTQSSGILSSVKSGVTSTGNHIVNGLKTINNTGGGMGDLIAGKVGEKTGSKLGGWAAGEIVKKIYTTALWSVVGVITKLIKDIVFKAFRMVSETFNGLRSATNEAPQAA